MTGHPAAKSRRGIPAGHGKRQGKVTRAEDHDRAQGTQHGAQVRLGSRFTLCIGAVDPSHDPGAFLSDLGKQAKLATGTRSFTL